MKDIGQADITAPLTSFLCYILIYFEAYQFQL